MPGICTVEFGLDTPADWGVRMVEIGAKFFYQDEDGNPAGDYYTSKLANILTGGRDTVSSNDASKCTYQIFAVAKISIPGESDRNLSGHDSTDKTQCLIRCPFIIAPKSKSQSAVTDLSNILSEPSIDMYSVGLFKKMIEEYAKSLETNGNK